MKERPILFSAEMVRALLDGRKTQTRRAIKPQPSSGLHWSQIVVDGHGGWVDGHGTPLRCPYGQPGDRLWVRETHAQVLEVDIPRGRPMGPVGTAGIPSRPDWKSRYVYRADGEMPNVQWAYLGDSSPVYWSPSIHMPRRASRILLEVTAIRVERLQEITLGDVCKEGLARSVYDFAPVQRGFEAFNVLWESINGTGSWDENPWVWVVEFRVIQPSEVAA